MARARKGSDLESRDSRLKKLRTTHHPYWVNVAQGVAVGYRRGPKATTWHARFHEGGTRYTFRDMGAADDYQDANGETILTYFQACEKARELAKGRDRARGIGVTGEVTVGQCITEYVKWFKGHRKSVKVTERIISTYIRPTFEDKRVADLKKNSIKAWFSALATTPARKRTKLGKPQEFRAAPTTEDQNRARRATANRTLSVLKAVLNYAAENDMIVARGPWVDVKPHKVADKPIERFLSTDEVTRLLNASPPDLRRLARGALLTGARYGELTDLRVADVTIEPNAGRVYLRETKNGIPRHVPLSPEGIAFFTEIITGKVGIDFVFVKANGTPWARNHAVRPLALACTAGNISPAISFHMLRHSYASLLAQAGADLLTISKLLGHKDTRITERHYAHLCERTLSNAVTNLLPNFGFKPDPKVVSITAGAK